MAGTEDVRSALRKRYAPPEWFLMEEVRNKTGYVGRERYADAVAMNMWPSRGTEVLGFEIKSSRQDWRNELSNPEKSSLIQKYCDRWWVVVADKKIVKDGELPPTWGLMALSKRGLDCVKEAPKLEAAPLDRLFVASLLRRAGERVVNTEKRDDNYKRGYDAGVAAGRELVPHDYRAVKRELQVLKSHIERFEKHSGVDLGMYNHDIEGVAEAFKKFQSMKYSPDAQEAMERARRQLQSGMDYLDVQLTVMRMMNGDQPRDEQG